MKRFYRPELDGLRFVAFFLVFQQHTFLFKAGGEHHAVGPRMANLLATVRVLGDFGVDLFFVLSAYLITELLLREREQRGSLDIGAFYLRRILRIWPLYFFALALAWTLTHFGVPRGFPNPTDEQMDGYHLLAFSFFAGNWAYLIRPFSSMAVPLWSVSVEEQFYLLWPWAVRRGTRARLIAVAVGILVVAATLRFFMAGAQVHEPWFSKGSLTRADGIALGILLAAWSNAGLPRLTAFRRAALLVFSAVSLTVVAFRFDLLVELPTRAHVTLGWTWVAVACAALALAVMGDTRGPGRVLSHPVFIYLGRISFGLYVFHELALLISDRLFPGYDRHPLPWVKHWLFGLGLSIAIASLSFRFLERPFLRLKDRFTVVPSRPNTAVSE